MSGENPATVVFFPAPWDSPTPPVAPNPSPDPTPKPGNSPGPAGPGTGPTAPGVAPSASTPRIPLLPAIQILRGTFRDPRAPGTLLPLPPHQWEVYNVHDRSRALVGSVSNDKGVSALMDSTLLDHPSPDWFISLRPLLGATYAEVETNVKVFAQLGEAWIDVDQRSWVLLPSLSVLEKRRLVRIPLWTSTLKAISGGLVDGPPLTDFQKTGVLRTSHLRTPYGTMTKPWQLQVDHNWHGTWVRFSYYHARDKAYRPLPPGLVVEALGVRTAPDGKTRSSGPLRIGGGTSMDGAGTVYVLQQRAAADSLDLDLSFRLAPSQATFVDLQEKPAGDPRSDHRMLQAPPPTAPAEPTEVYTLPVEFCSSGWSVARAAGRAAWASARTAPTSAADPVDFCLDDIVLTDAQGAPLTTFLLGPKGEPPHVALFDHLLCRRDVNPAKPHLWRGAPKQPHLAANSAFAKPKQKIVETTRLVAYEGKFFDVGGKRVISGGAPIGLVPGIGARAAIQDDHAMVDYLHGIDPLAIQVNKLVRHPGMCQIRLIASPLARETYKGESMPLVHAAITVPCDLAVPTPDDDLYRMLILGEQRWSQGYARLVEPEDPQFTAPGKSYIAVPRSGAPRSLIRFRLIMACKWPDGDGKTLTMRDAPAPGTALTFIDHDHGRRELLIGKDGYLPTGKPMQDADGVPFRDHVFAHELAHVLGHYDEYPKFELPMGVSMHLLLNHSRIPGFIQDRLDAGNAVPFAGDVTALAFANGPPRLRYYWPFMMALNEQAPFAGALSDRPYVLEHADYPGGLRYDPPDVSAAFSGSGSVKPWRPIWQTKTGRSDLLLFRVGDDEGSVELAFQPVDPGKAAPAPLSAGRRFDGLVVLRTYLWFDFDGPLAKGAGDVTGADPQWRVLRRIHERLYHPVTGRLACCFSIEPNPVHPSSSSLLFRRLALIIQPQFEFGPHHGRTTSKDLAIAPAAPLPTKQGSGSASVQQAISPHVWCIVEDDAKKAVPHPMIQPHVSGMPIRIGASQVNLSLLRFALGLPWRQPSGLAWAPVDSDLDAAEMGSIMSLLAQRLGDPNVPGVPSRVIHRMLP